MFNLPAAAISCAAPSAAEARTARPWSVLASRNACTTCTSRASALSTRPSRASVVAAANSTCSCHAGVAAAGRHLGLGGVGMQVPVQQPVQLIVLVPSVHVKDQFIDRSGSPVDHEKRRVRHIS